MVVYIFETINKLFISTIPNKYIPLQNLIIDFVSTFICYFMKIKLDLFSAIIMCSISTMGAESISNLL